MSAPITLELRTLPLATPERAAPPSVVTRTESTHHNHTILVVFQGSQSRFSLRLLEATTTETGEQVMTRLKELWLEDTFQSKVSRLIRLFFWKPVIEEVSIQNIPSTNVESLQYLIEVIISTRTLSPALTAAFCCPSLLYLDGPFITRYPNMLLSLDSRVGIMVAKELNKGSMFWIIVAALCGSITIGLLVGLWCSWADLGIASTSGLFGIIAVIVGVFFWMFK
ncbi:hypothetical protein ACEPPN_016516 [Leptodophora sp. 'Broadleaf-Isolate-01']